MTQIHTKYPHLIKDISLVSLDPTDQVLNFLLSNTHVVLQLSRGEGFEVKKTEAKDAGRPVIATHIGGTALQVKHEETGFFVRPCGPQGYRGLADATHDGRGAVESHEQGPPRRM